jgi:alpha-amylase
VHGATVALEIAAPDGGVIASKTIHHGDPAAALVALTRQQGWHTLSAHASRLARMAPYELNVTYQGAQQMEESRP